MVSLLISSHCEHGWLELDAKIFFAVVFFAAQEEVSKKQIGKKICTILFKTQEWFTPCSLLIKTGAYYNQHRVHTRLVEILLHYFSKIHFKIVKQIFYSEIIIERHWRGRVSRSVGEKFWEEVKKAGKPENVPPVISTPKHYVVHIHKHDLFFVGVVRLFCKCITH